MHPPRLGDSLAQVTLESWDSKESLAVSEDMHDSGLDKGAVSGCQ